MWSKTGKRQRCPTPKVERAIFHKPVDFDRALSAYQVHNGTYPDHSWDWNSCKHLPHVDIPVPWMVWDRYKIHQDHPVWVSWLDCLLRDLRISGHPNRMLPLGVPLATKSLSDRT